LRSGQAAALRSDQYELLDVRAVDLHALNRE